MYAGPVNNQIGTREMKIKNGDHVCYAREWLRNTGQYTGDVPFMRGVVTEIRNGYMATVEWDIGETYPVHCANLWPAGKRYLEPV